MKNTFLHTIAAIGVLLLNFPFSLSAAIDMQAHVCSDEGRAAYTSYLAAQKQFYTQNYADSILHAQYDTDLFRSLNTLMGDSCRNDESKYNYDALRYQYNKVDRDLNTQGNIIGFYDGKSIFGIWDGGTTWNREHVWPQSKGVSKDYPMGYDMQSVRPTSNSVNSGRGNKAYGEAGAYYDPDDEKMNNSNYKESNLGSYRGDAARIILYDYIVYGAQGKIQNKHYNGEAQLLDKIGSHGLFESLPILIKWSMQDPPSLTEMVRNDGAHTYQGNRNPFIDYPELVIQLLSKGNGVVTYSVTTKAGYCFWPNYTLTTSSGFIGYLYDDNNDHPKQVTVTGASSEYDNKTGRLIIRNVTGPVSIVAPKSTSISGLEEIGADSQPARIYTISGDFIGNTTAEDLNHYISLLPAGLYIIHQGNYSTKVIR